MKKILSVIMPVYNTGELIKKSILSVMEQTIINKIELIVVDDGSTDDSLDIINEIAKSYDDFLVIHQKKSGVSSARNKGIECARGEYVTFIDSDDFMEPYHCEYLLNLILSGDYDLAIGNYTKVFSTGFERTYKKKCKKEWNNSNDTIESFFLDDIICNNVVDKIFKTSVVKKVHFPQGYSIGEDMYFIYHVLKKCNKVILDTSKSYYKYIIRNNSAMKRNPTEKDIDGIRLSYMILQHEDNLAFKRLAEANYIHEICKFMNREYMSGEFVMSKGEVHKQNFYNYSYLSAFRYMNTKTFVAYILMRTLPGLYSYLYRWMKIG